MFSDICIERCIITIFPTFLIFYGGIVTTLYRIMLWISNTSRKINISDSKTIVINISVKSRFRNTDFISIIEYRQLLGKHPSHHHLELVGAVARTGIETQMVVIAGNGSKVAPVFGPVNAFGIAVIVFEQHRLGIHTPVDFVLRPRIAVEVLKRLLASVEREIYSTVRLMLLVEVHAAVA